MKPPLFKCNTMNHVHLIGKISSEPRIFEQQDGRKVVQFILTTKDVYLNAQGEKKHNTNWHKMSAWGSWVSVLETLGEKGLHISIEGRLISKFYGKAGQKRIYSEVEINDLVLL